ncbi:MAG: hypothetical protein HQ591_03390 [candidate division Zixibacteria bacterium]|nr:hypothetical protein [Candidatus Tariuqbacter arcticus]
MLKKFLVLSLIITFSALPLMAAESEPSNTVGFISFESAEGAWVPFAFPFSYYTDGHVYTTTLGECLGGNWFEGTLGTGDRIWDQNLMGYVFNFNGNWVGAFTDITPGRAYWAYVIPGNPTVTGVTAGEVDMNPLNMGTMESGLYNPVGLREPGAVMLGNSNLLESGFTGGSLGSSDRIWDQNLMGYSFYLIPPGTWVGGLVTPGLEGGHALWVQVLPGNPSFEWTYIPLGNVGPSPESIIITPEIEKPVPVNTDPNRVLRKVGTAPASGTD